MEGHKKDAKGEFLSLTVIRYSNRKGVKEQGRLVVNRGWQTGNLEPDFVGCLSITCRVCDRGQVFSVNHTISSAFPSAAKCVILDGFLSVASLGCLPPK